LETPNLDNKPKLNVAVEHLWKCLVIIVEVGNK